VRIYCAIGAWILIGVLTYIYIRFGSFGKNVFQYNLKCEGSSSDAIHIFCILFGLAWPLWWVFMLPIQKLIGRHDDKWFECQRRLRGK